jgi:hypothetical protein
MSLLMATLTSDQGLVEEAQDVASHEVLAFEFDDNTEPFIVCRDAAQLSDQTMASNRASSTYLCV